MSTNKYPKDKDCLQLLREEGCTKRVMIHCATVRAVADEIVSHIPDADKELVVAGALLHDIGRQRTHNIMHAVVGAQIAEIHGLPKELVEIIRKHTGAGIDPEDAAQLGLPPGDYIPRTIEEKIVAHQDNLVSDNAVVCVNHQVEKLQRKGANRGAQRVAELHKELSLMYGADLDCIVDIIGEHPKLKGIQP